MRSGASAWRARAWRYGPAALALPGLLLAPEGRLAAWVLLCLAAAVVQAVRLEWPWATWGAACALAVAFTGLRPETYLVAQFVPLFPFAQLATSGDLRRTGALLLVTAGLCLGLTVAAAGATLGGGSINVVLSVLFLPVPLYGAAAAWAHGLATRRLYAEALLERAERLERDQQRRAELAVVAERARIARDLHDVVTHGVAVMVVQADAADVVWDADPGRSHDAVRQVAETGRTVMDELRAMLDAMRGLAEPGAGTPRAASGSLQQAGDLVARLDAAGVAAALHVTGDLDRVPPTTGLAAERLLREALTNVLRHARAQRTEVRIDVGETDIRIRVADDGVGIGVAPAEGYGIPGMRERVALAGGTFLVAPRPEGGTLIEAVLPLEAA